MFSKEFLAFFKDEYKPNTQRALDEKNVIKRYSEIFAPENLGDLTREDFHSFLCFSQNKHWDGIHRNSNDIMKNMNKLREALRILLDESIDISERLNILIPKKEQNFIPYLGKAILTSILLIVYPEKYGVYNKRSYRVMRRLKVFKNKPHRISNFGEEYSIINKKLLDIATDLNLTLWQLDYLWWYYEKYGHLYALPQIPDLEESLEIRREEIRILRSIRETKISNELKEIYDYSCQVCDKQIPIDFRNEIKFYIEAHHLKPMALKHNGPDIRSNLLILCPNHHAEFDYGAIAINPIDNITLLHKDECNPFYKHEMEFKHKIEPKYVKYHYKIFKGEL